MIRYELYSVDPLNEDDQRFLDGTYPLELARQWVAACYADPNCMRIPRMRPVRIHARRHTYYVEASGRRWHLVADSPLQAARAAARRGVPARVWWCKDDYAAGCPPLTEQQRLAC